MPGKAVGNFVRNNAGSIAASAAFNLGDLTTPGNQLKGILGTLKDLAIWRVAAVTGFAGLFVMLASGLKGLVKDTGSLDAALKKLAKVDDLTRAFERFTGSTKKARAEVKLFVEFARDKSLKFEQVADAAKNLATFGRGILGGVQNLNLLNDAAAATGNTFSATADAASQFAEALNTHSGIPEAVDNMEKMRLISAKTSDTLKEMNVRGGTRSGMLQVFRQDIGSHPGAAAAAGQTGEGVKARHTAALTAMKEEFGKGFAGDAIKSQEEQTTIMEMMTPYVGKAGHFLKQLLKYTTPGWLIKDAAAGWGARLAPGPSVKATSAADLKVLKTQQERARDATMAQEALEWGLGRQAQRRGLELEDLQQLSTMHGDTGYAERIRSKQLVEGRFNQFVAAGYDRDYAAQRATTYAQRQIQIEGDQGRVSLNAAAAVSELARIGGGGGVEGVSGSMTEIAQRQLDVETDMKEILSDIKNLLAFPESTGLY